MKKIYAFILGLLEYRSEFSSHVGWKLNNSYDLGRKIARRLFGKKITF
jgi:hypothetical protein